MGCGPAIAMRVSDVHIAPKRVAVMQADVILKRLDASSQLTFMPDWSQEAADNVNAALKDYAAWLGAPIFRCPNGKDVLVPCDVFREWSNQALIEISRASAGDDSLRKKSVSDWRFPRGMDSWRKPLNANFVLVTAIRGSYETPGMSALQLSGAWMLHSKQTAIACVLDLRDGRIIRCETRVTQNADLLSPKGAQALVDGLLDRLFCKGAL